MSVVFNIILNMLLLGSLLMFAITFIGSAWNEPNRGERLMRIAAVFAGALIALGATASGVNYAAYTVQALAQARTASATAHFFSLFVPALAGVGIGFFLVRTMRKSTVMTVRIMGFVGMLATTAFIEVYAQAATINGFKLGAAALPNIAFTAGVILTVVFTWRPDATESRGGSVARSFVSQLLQRGTNSGSRPAGQTGSGSPAAYFASSQSDDHKYRGL